MLYYNKSVSSGYMYWFIEQPKQQKIFKNLCSSTIIE